MKHLIKMGLSLCVISSLLSSCQQTVISDTEISGTASSIVEQISDAGSAAQTILEDLQNELPEFTDSAAELATEIVQNTSKLIEEAKNSTATQTEFEEVSLVYVVDGDTLVVLGDDGLEYKVRLIGIDTPESVHSDVEKNNVFGEDASRHTKEMLENVQTLYLEYDKQVTDVYNRTLAYVWMTPDTTDVSNMLNAKILMDGYAIDKVYEPNHKYADVFANLCLEANENHTGLWQAEGYHALTGR